MSLFEELTEALWGPTPSGHVRLTAREHHDIASKGWITVYVSKENGEVAILVPDRLSPTLRVTVLCQDSENLEAEFKLHLSDDCHREDDERFWFFVDKGELEKAEGGE